MKTKLGKKSGFLSKLSNVFYLVYLQTLCCLVTGYLGSLLEKNKQI